MKRQGVMKLVFAAFVLLSANFSFAGSSKEEAVAFVKKAAEFFKANGKEKSLAEFSNPNGSFVKGDLYLTVWDFNGNQIAHGANPKLIGKNLTALKDADGKEFVKDFMKIPTSATKTGWVDYRWTNATTKKIEAKSTYFEVADDVLIGAGIYK